MRTFGDSLAGLIAPDALAADACLDNLLVSQEDCRDMVSRGVDFRDRQVTAARSAIPQTEFIRCLIYSSQIMVDHTFLRGNYLQELSACSWREPQCLCRADADHVIMPFLFHESSLTEAEESDVRGEGDAAIRGLLGEVGVTLRDLISPFMRHCKLPSYRWTGIRLRGGHIKRHEHISDPRCANASTRAEATGP
jgi:hypothetical protein